MHGNRRSLMISLCAFLSQGCETQKVVIADWVCPQSSASNPPGSAGAGGVGSDSIPSEWSTGFEDLFCDYSAPRGFCYSTGSARYEVVSNPVHAGQYAVSFTVFGDGTVNNAQARCALEGTLPTEAYYGAWYYIPSVSRNNAVWNLIHFRGGKSRSDAAHGLWDISLTNNDSGDLRLTVYSFLGKQPDLSNAPPIPVGSWFHIQVFLKRAADATGELAVYQDGTPVLQLAGLVTDDSQWAQWYVGNSAVNLDPVESTLYVDDITITTTR
jgi:hypothetical protein